MNAKTIIGGLLTDHSCLAKSSWSRLSIFDLL
jgi:hypothetical protein